jgi:hypothetical protein
MAVDFFEGSLPRVGFTASPVAGDSFTLPAKKAAQCRFFVLPNSVFSVWDFACGVRISLLA